MRVALTNFARRRLFDADAGGSTLAGCTAEEFEAHIRAREPQSVLPGYAPFCQLWVYANWTRTPVSAVEITPENESQLRSAYEARTPEELPVLTRWLEGVEPPVARYLLVIVYSREQLRREGDEVDADWGVVGCLATAQPEETPMAPITLLRNALGTEEGGSGVSLDREAYRRSVEYWSRHANVRAKQEERGT